MARSNAIFELIERDAVLSQWYSAIPFLEVSPKELPSQIQDWAVDELCRSEFPILKILFSTEGLGPSITCVLMNQKGFGVFIEIVRAAFPAVHRTGICPFDKGSSRTEYDSRTFCLLHT